MVMAKSRSRLVNVITKVQAKTVAKIAVLMSVLLLSACSLNGKKVYQTQQGALRGFDPVAYFTENKAVQGLAQFSVQNSNSTWYFASLENQQRFEQSPEKYLPQYGGYCAYAMSYGLVVSSDPYAFSIIDNKLYLNYSLDVREKWLKNPQQFIKEADVHWQKKI